IERRDGKEFWRRGPVGDDFAHREVLPTLTQKAVQYIDQQAQTKDPFFLYFPLPAPHTPILPTEPFQGKSSTNEYGDFVLMVDDVVGQVMTALERNGLTDNTIVIFTSDNGCSPMADFEELASFGHDPSYVFRGHKADIFEGGHRVPFLVQWPGKIKAGSQSDQTICLTDLTRTIAALIAEKVEDDEAEDSYNILPILLGEMNNQPVREATVHHSINGSFSLRQDKWKAVFCPGSGGWSNPTPKEAKAQGLPLVQLFDLSQDIGEENNLTEPYPEVVERMKKLMEKYIEEGRSTSGKRQQNDTPTRLDFATADE
ncbi:MAG: sulfatase-like hydrolase/transferase, partial [Bacteroidetes bacterium]|nr:sulfatase-like hydrolase/transferase [Bacteroidota bacterium]